jgi:hypothetical protein
MKHRHGFSFGRSYKHFIPILKEQKIELSKEESSHFNPEDGGSELFWDVFLIKPTRCTNFTNSFWHETLHISGSSSAHHQELIHCTLSSFRAGPSWSCSKAVFKPV